MSRSRTRRRRTRQHRQLARLQHQRSTATTPPTFVGTGTLAASVIPRILRKPRRGRPPKRPPIAAPSITLNDLDDDFGDLVGDDDYDDYEAPLPYAVVQYPQQTDGKHGGGLTFSYYDTREAAKIAARPLHDIGVLTTVVDIRRKRPWGSGLASMFSAMSREARAGEAARSRRANGDVAQIVRPEPDPLPLPSQTFDMDAALIRLRALLADDRCTTTNGATPTPRMVCVQASNHSPWGHVKGVAMPGHGTLAAAIVVIPPITPPLDAAGVLTAQAEIGPKLWACIWTGRADDDGVVRREGDRQGSRVTSRWTYYYTQTEARAACDELRMSQSPIVVFLGAKSSKHRLEGNELDLETRRLRRERREGAEARLKARDGPPEHTRGRNQYSPREDGDTPYSNPPTARPDHAWHGKKRVTR